MSLTHDVPVALLGACVLASGCFMQEEEGLPFDRVPDVATTPLEGTVSTNGLIPSDFWAPARQQALRSLGAAPLLDKKGDLVATPLLNSTGGRSVLRYALRCALGKDAAVESAGGSTFEGEHDLAPDWTSRALTTSEQRWVTACLLDHLNGLGQSVNVMMDGHHSALVPEPGEDTSGYKINDMTAFGNVFLEAPKAYVCIDLGVNLACGVGFSAYTLQRLCGLSLTCGATILGLCGLVCTHDAAGDPTCTAPLGATYPEAISTKLKETGAVSLYPLCSLL